MNLLGADRLYAVAASATVRPILIRHHAVREFAHALKRFEHSLGDHVEDEYWVTRLRTLKRYRFTVCATPLGFEAPNKRHESRFSELLESLDRCDAIYPAFAGVARDIVRRALALTRLNENPVLDALITAAGGEEAAVVIPESRYVEATEILLSRQLHARHLRVRTPAELQGDATYESIILIGPLRWFPDHVVTAPRASTVDQIRFAFLSDGWQPRAMLHRPLTTHSVRFERAEVPVVDERESEEADEGLLAPEDVLPAPDWESFLAKARQQSDSECPTHELAEARFIGLANGKAVFLEADAKELVVDPRSPDPIRAVRVKDLDDGLNLVVRDRGQGAYIVPIADRLLGTRAQEYRKAQAEWKSRLRQLVAVHGTEAVVAKLRRYGARAASATNVRSWSSSSPRRIRPRYFEDFRAILLLLDMDDQTQYLWGVAKAINKAHHRAGRKMRQRLLGAVRGADLSELIRRGQQAFHFAEYETRLTAHRIVAVEDEPVAVALAQIGELLEAPEDAWRA